MIPTEALGGKQQAFRNQSSSVLANSAECVSEVGCVSAS